MFLEFVVGGVCVFGFVVGGVVTEGEGGEGVVE